MLSPLRSGLFFYGKEIKLNQKSFLEKYRISADAFEKGGCNWDELVAVSKDFEKRRGEMLDAGNFILSRLREIPEVHSLKIRVKDPEHLIEKIIRKKEKDPERELSLNTYLSNITDLIGIRALHLFKDEWHNIHKNIQETWELHEPTIAFIREGDLTNVFEESGCDVKHHPHGYRSVHYLAKSKPAKTAYITEIQVRTIFEEGWCEIDHRLRYPYDMDNIFLSEYLAIFNRLAGSSDEMGTYIKNLKQALEAKEQMYQKGIKEHEAKTEAILKQMEELKSILSAESKEKKNLQHIIDDLKKQQTPVTVFGLKDYASTLYSGLTLSVPETQSEMISLSALAKPDLLATIRRTAITGLEKQEHVATRVQEKDKQ